MSLVPMVKSNRLVVMTAAFSLVVSSLASANQFGPPPQLVDAVIFGQKKIEDSKTSRQQDQNTLEQYTKYKLTLEARATDLQNKLSYSQQNYPLLKSQVAAAAAHVSAAEAMKKQLMAQDEADQAEESNENGLAAAADATVGEIAARLPGERVRLQKIKVVAQLLDEKESLQAQVPQLWDRYQAASSDEEREKIKGEIEALEGKDPDSKEGKIWDKQRDIEAAAQGIENLPSMDTRNDRTNAIILANSAVEASEFERNRISNEAKDHRERAKKAAARRDNRVQSHNFENKKINDNNALIASLTAKMNEMGSPESIQVQISNNVTAIKSNNETITTYQFRVNNWDKDIQNLTFDLDQNKQKLLIQQPVRYSAGAGGVYFNMPAFEAQKWLPMNQQNIAGPIARTLYGPSFQVGWNNNGTASLIIATEGYFGKVVGNLANNGPTPQPGPTGPAFIEFNTTLNGFIKSLIPVPNPPGGGAGGPNGGGGSNGLPSNSPQAVQARERELLVNLHLFLAGHSLTCNPAPAPQKCFIQQLNQKSIALVYEGAVLVVEKTPSLMMLGGFDYRLRRMALTNFDLSSSQSSQFRNSLLSILMQP